jgi:Phage regulatory protein CII (CP76)
LYSPQLPRLLIQTARLSGHNRPSGAIIIMSRGEDFADLVHRVLVNDDRYSLATAASGMGMLYETLYARVRNRTCFSAEEIRSLIKTVPDPRIVSYFLEATGFVAVERPATRDVGGPEIELLPAAHRLVFGASDVLKLLEAALREGKVDHREAIKIEGELDALERVLLALREKIKAQRGGAAEDLGAM